jgi:protein required for attachment to host cells
MASKNKEWIVLADRAHAKIFTHDYVNGQLKEILVVADTQAQERQHDMGTDRPGRGHGSSSRHSYEDHADFPEQESAMFLTGIAEELNDAAKSDMMDKLILVALPKTLAVIKSKLNQQAKSKLTAEYAKNLISVDETTLIDRLAKLKEL